MKKAFTLVELIISIALLGIIMAAVSSIFAVAVRNYRVENQRSEMQQNLNFLVDNMGKDIKQAAEIPFDYDTFTRSSEVLIMAVPAVDTSENFIYSSGNSSKDYIIYYKEGNSLKKKVYPSQGSSRYASESVLINDVSNFDATYNPADIPSQVTVNLDLSKQIGKVTININGVKTANLRNR